MFSYQGSTTVMQTDTLDEQSYYKYTKAMGRRDLLDMYIRA